MKTPLLFLIAVMLALVNVSCSHARSADGELFEARLEQTPAEWSVAIDTVDDVRSRALGWFADTEYRIAVDSDEGIETTGPTDERPFRIRVAFLPISESSIVVSVHTTPKYSHSLKQAGRITKSLAYYMQTGRSPRDGLDL